MGDERGHCRGDLRTKFPSDTGLRAGYVRVKVETIAKDPECNAATDTRLLNRSSEKVDRLEMGHRETHNSEQTGSSERDEKARGGWLA